MCAKFRKIINNSARYCSISLKFRTDFDHMTLDVPQTFKVNGLKVKVTAWHSVSAISFKNAIIQAPISCQRSTWCQRRAQHVTHVQGHKVKYWNRYNSAANWSTAFKFGKEFHHITCDTLQMLKVKGHSWRSQRKVMYQQQKSYNTAMDRFSNVKLGMAS